LLLSENIFDALDKDYVAYFMLGSTTWDALVAAVRDYYATERRALN
jgi:hypothetical protein